MIDLTAKTTTYEILETTANTVADWFPPIEWTSLTNEEIEADFEQKKKDNKLHIEVRRKDLFR